MKIKLVISALLVFSISISAQPKTVVTKSMIKFNYTAEVERGERIFDFNDKQIIVKNFKSKGKNFVLNINKIERNREYDYREGCIYYYCTSINPNNSSKVLVVVSEFTIWMAIYATELDVFRYEFSTTF